LRKPWVYQVGRREQDGFQHIRRSASLYSYIFLSPLFNHLQDFNHVILPNKPGAFKYWQTSLLPSTRRCASPLAAQETRSDCFSKDYIVIFISPRLKVFGRFRKTREMSREESQSCDHICNNPVEIFAFLTAGLRDINPIVLGSIDDISQRQHTCLICSMVYSMVSKSSASTKAHTPPFASETKRLPLPSPEIQSWAIASSFLIHGSSFQKHGYISVLRASKPHLGYQSVVYASSRNSKDTRDSAQIPIEHIHACIRECDSNHCDERDIHQAGTRHLNRSALRHYKVFG
jgi:hypothetical protein